MEKSRVEASSPLATIEDIQRRLIRPPSLHSQSSASFISSRNDLRRRDSSQFNANATEFQIKREATNKRLEDYLDPVLLSTICDKIGGKRKRDGEIKLKEFEFEWPIDQLKVFAEVSRTEKREKRMKNDAVDLNDYRDLIGGVGDEEEVSCTPFRRFEGTALKQLER